MASNTDGIRRIRPARTSPPQLSDILRPEGKGNVDMTRLERKKRNPRRTLIITLSAAILLLAVAITGFFFFLRKDKEYSGSSIAVSHEVPDRIAAGEDFPLTLTVTNTDAVTLHDLVLTLQYPDGYSIKSADRSAGNDAKNAFNLGTLGPGKETTLTLTGNLLGAVGDEKTFGLTFTFRPENFNYQFNEATQVSVSIATSVLTMDIDGPQEIAPEAEGTWTVKLKNVSGDALTALRVALKKPDNFTLTSSDPVLSDDLRWSVDRLDASAEHSLHFSGRFAETDQEFVEFSFTSAINRNSVEDPQGSASVLILLVKPDLSLTIQRTGDNRDAALQPGDRVPLTIAYTNNSELSLTDVILTLTIDDASPLDTGAMESSPAAERDGRRMIWSKEQLTALGQVKPRATGSVDVTLAVPKTITPENDGDYNPDFVVHASSRVGAVSDITNSSLVGEERTLTIPIATVLTVSGEARYYDEEGVSIGSGPIPPESGKATTYVIQWFANNTTSDVGNFTVTATIPPNVFWPGEDFRASAGELRFNPETREARWTVNTVPAGSGSVAETLSARFTVRITPGANDVGSTPILVDAAQVTGTDVHTSAVVGGSIETMTTDLIHDARGRGNGVVIAGT